MGFQKFDVSEIMPRFCMSRATLSLTLLASASALVQLRPAVLRAGPVAPRASRPACGLVLTEENVQAVLAECQDELGTLFGTNEQSRRVGITGRCEFVELEGPTIILRLSGRFWHQRTVVVERVSKYVLDRIPECIGVEVEDAAQLDDADVDALEATLDAIYEAPQFGNET